MKKTILVALLSLAGSCIGSASSVVNWIVWTNTPSSYNLTTTNGYHYANFAAGYIVDPNSGQTINVTYRGEISDQSVFNGLGYNNQYNIFSFAAYTNSATVPSAPTSKNYIAFTGFSGLTNTFTFSAPISNFVMDIASLGGTGAGASSASYNFNNVPTVLSSGTGQFGTQIIPLTVTNGTSVYGQEGNGAIQFNGSMTSNSWTAPKPEYYSAFTVGIASQNAVPEPSTYALFGLGAVALVFAARRRLTA
jgi:hypothetical protein